jgi:hypothetical protein
MRVRKNKTGYRKRDVVDSLSNLDERNKEEVKSSSLPLVFNSTPSANEFVYPRAIRT